MNEMHGSVVADRLIEQIRTLVDGNHVVARDVLELERHIDDCSVRASVTWSFEHETAERTVVGKEAVPEAHHEFSRNQLDVTVKRLREVAITDRELRVPFMQRVVTAGSNSLAWSSTTQTVKDFGEQSVYRHCSSCGGTGELVCSTCSGRGRYRCSSCGGGGTHSVAHQVHSWNGKSNETRTEYRRENCSGCNGTGDNVCHSCGGSGKIRCSSCNGHGLFTDLIRITAVAHPTWSVEVDTSIQAVALQAHLLSLGATESATHIDLEVVKTSFNEDDAWHVQFQGINKVAEVSFSLSDKHYIAACVGNVSYPFIRPPLFNDIFSDEIAQLQKLNDQAGNPQIKGKLAKSLFKDYQKQPILDRAMKTIAQLKGDEREHPLGAVVDACSGFISIQPAQQLGRGILGLLHKVSPPYSSLAWVVVMSIPVLNSFLGIARELETSTGWFTPLMMTVVYLFMSLLLAYLFSWVAWACSVFISFIRRRFTPKLYRQKGRDMEPRDFAYLAVCLAFVLGIIYGLSARAGWAPQIGDKPQRVERWIGEKLRSISGLKQEQKREQ